jgi:hypothetical protein
MELKYVTVSFITWDPDHECHQDIFQGGTARKLAYTLKFQSFKNIFTACSKVI